MLIQFQRLNCIIILAALKALQTAQRCVKFSGTATKKLIFYQKNEEKKNRKPIQAKLTNNEEEK